MSCWKCKHQNIQEHGYEWLDCLCKLDGEWHSIHGCKYFEAEEIEEGGTEDA